MSHSLLHACVSHSCRQQKSKYHVSDESIAKARREVGAAVMKCIYPAYVKLPGTLPDLSGQYFTKHFQGCYGCVDGSHFEIIVPADMKEDYINRKGSISTNAMLICHCDNSLCFQYANFGAEGNGGDSIILRECSQKGLKFLEGNILEDSVICYIIYIYMLYVIVIMT